MDATIKTTTRDEAAKPPIRISLRDFTPAYRPRGAAVGYATVALTDLGLVIFGVVIKRRAEKVFVQLPSVPIVRRGIQRTGPAGDYLWNPVVRFEDLSVFEAFSQAVIMAAREAYPRAFA